MINFDDVSKGNIRQHNPNWPQIPDYLYRILIIRGAGSGKKSSLFNLINQQLGVDKIYLYAKAPYKAKHQLLITKRKSAGLKYLMIQKILLSIRMIQMIFIKNIEEHNPNKNENIDCI